VKLEGPCDGYLVGGLYWWFVTLYMNHIRILIARLAVQMDRTQQQHNTGTTGMTAYPSGRNQENGIDSESTASKANNS